MASAPVSRRERHRAETREEAKRLALAQLAESGQSGQSGLGGLSLTAIARQMGVTGPALYRYFAGRDDLLAELASDAYEDLADTVHAAAYQPGPPRTRVYAVAAAYRDWTLSQPHRYRLLFGAGTPPGARSEPAARRTMAALLAAMTEQPDPTERVEQPGPSGGTGSTGLPGPAGPELDPDDRTAAGPAHSALARLGVAAWTRWHGVLSLQIDGHLGALGADPGLAFQGEVDSVVDTAERLAARPGPDRPDAG